MNAVIKRLFKSGLPVMPVMTHPGIDLIGKCVQDAVTDGAIHADAIKALRKAWPQSVAATTIMDLSVEAEAFGADIVFEPGSVPTVSGRLLENAEMVNALAVPGLDKGRVPEYLKAVRLASADIDVPLFGGCIGPFSLAGRLYEMTELMMAMYIEPDTVCTLLQKCTDFIMAYVKAMKESGASGVVMAEPASGLLSDDDCMTYSSVYVKQIVDLVQDDGFAVILHNCGNQGQCTDAMIATGAAGLHFGNSIDMETVLKSVPQDIAVMGNIDPVGVFKMGNPDDMRNAVAHLKDISKGYSNFVLSSGCDVPPETPSANIAAFFESAR